MAIGDEPKSHSVEIKEKKNFKIMIAEDEEGPRQALLEMFHFFDYPKVESVANGEELIEKIFDSNLDEIPSLIIVDKTMRKKSGGEGMSGLEVIEKIRSSTNEFIRNIPIIMLTAEDATVEKDIQDKWTFVCLGKSAHSLMQIGDEIEKIRTKSKNK